jgi:capsular polysaccharide transport system permease protein
MADALGLIPSARVQGRIIGALLRREILTRYGRHNIGFMWLFIEPMMFTSGVLLLWTALGLHKVALPIVGFVLSGYATVLMWRNTINHAGDSVEPNRALMHHRNVRVIDLFAARIILEVAGASMSFFILGLSLTAVGLMDPPDDILKMLVAWLLLTWFSAGMALVIGPLVVLSESARRVWHVVGYLFLPLSGAFFMINWLPQYAQDIVIWIPTVSCTELLREGLFGAEAMANYKLTYLVVVNTVLLLPGLLLVRYIASRVEGE